MTTALPCGMSHELGSACSFSDETSFLNKPAPPVSCGFPRLPKTTDLHRPGAIPVPPPAFAPAEPTSDSAASAPNRIPPRTPFPPVQSSLVTATHQGLSETTLQTRSPTYVRPQSTYSARYQYFKNFSFALNQIDSRQKLARHSGSPIKTPSASGMSPNPINQNTIGIAHPHLRTTSTRPTLSPPVTKTFFTRRKQFTGRISEFCGGWRHCVPCSAKIGG